MIASYIHFTENAYIQSKMVTVFSNDKLWFCKELTLCVKKKQAFKSGDRDLYKVARYEFEQAVRKVKAKYKDGLQDKLQSKDSRGVW